MKWTVYRQTPTNEVWACAAHGVEAGSGVAAIEQVANGYAGSSHLMGHYFAVPDEAHVFAYTRTETQHVSTVTVEADPEWGPGRDRAG